jgi:phosphinothricin acetyltransferase
MTQTLRMATPDDAPGMLAIYAKVVRETAISFEYEPPEPAAFRAKIEKLLATHACLVLEDRAGVAAYAYGSEWRGRIAYSWSTETTVYVREDARGRGAGRRIYGALLEALTLQGFRLAIGGIALPNAASVALHELLGYRPVGTHHGCGFKLGRWHDVGFWEKELLPRRDGEQPAAPRPPAAMATDPRWMELLARP